MHIGVFAALLLATEHTWYNILSVSQTVCAICSYNFSTDDATIFTHACIIAQIALRGGLHQMMKGAYNSGKYAMYFSTCVHMYVVYFQMHIVKLMQITWLTIAYIVDVPTIGGS